MWSNTCTGNHATTKIMVITNAYTCILCFVRFKLVCMKNTTLVVGRAASFLWTSVKRQIRRCKASKNFQKGKHVVLEVRAELDLINSMIRTSSIFKVLCIDFCGPIYEFQNFKYILYFPSFIYIQIVITLVLHVCKHFLNICSEYN
jgi:hypothetical protein